MEIVDVVERILSFVFLFYFIIFYLTFKSFDYKSKELELNQIKKLKTNK